MKPKRIYVAMPVRVQTNRLHLEGIVRYARERTSPMWQFHLEIGDNVPQHLTDLVSWGCDGIIAKIDKPEDRRRYLTMGIPCVFYEPSTLNVKKVVKREKVATFFNDHAEEGRTAAEYFLARRYRSFAYVGSQTTTPWSTERQRGFAERLAQAGFGCEVYRMPSRAEREDFSRESKRMTKWLKSLPVRTAILVVHDRRAQQVISTASFAGISVPDKLSVLGVDDDWLICTATTPAISSIAVDAEPIGFSFAETLDAMMKGAAVPHYHRTVHSRVITRASTDATAVNDPFVARAIAKACRNPGDDLTIETLAREVGCSKRTLQMRVMKELGTTIGDEVARLRLTEALRLLMSTNRSIAEIAHACGFCGASHLGLRLREVYGKTPSEIRAGRLDCRRG